MVTYSQNGHSKIQISDHMKQMMKEDSMMTETSPNLITAKIVNKDQKTIPTGELFVFTLQIEGSEAFPNDWSTFKEELFDQVNEGETWKVSVSTKPNLKKPGEVYRNVIEFVERVSPSKKAVSNDEEELADWEKQELADRRADIPNEREAIGTPYPPDDPTWWEKRLMQGLTAKDMNINVAVALKAVADVIVAKSATPQLYDPANAFDDLIVQTRRVCREVYMMPFAEHEEQSNVV